jgi:protoheme IX farnesyltransferase
MTGVVYLLASLYLNGVFIHHAWRLKFKPDLNTAMATFRFSIVHLMLLFVALLVDHYVLAFFAN